MQIPIYQIDAFSNEIFKGNPAAVCPLNSWLDDTTLKRIAQENNLSETAYFTKEDETTFNLRWFTPEYEIDLCGHATLATAHVILNELNYKGDTVNFKTLSGLISVKKEDDFLILNLPCRPGKVSELPEIIFPIPKNLEKCITKMYIDPQMNLVKPILKVEAPKGYGLDDRFDNALDKFSNFIYRINLLISQFRIFIHVFIKI